MATVLSSERHSSNPETTLAFRVFDLVVSGLGLLLLSPVFLFIGLAVKLTSPGPVFVRTTRVGKDGNLFKQYAFRSMYLGTEHQAAAFSMRSDHP